MFKALALSLVALTLVAQSPKPLEPSLRIDLKRLEETWHLLDRHAQSIWPGWTTYRDVPFKYSYPNLVEMLVGHPDPTDGFEPVKDGVVDGKTVLLDRRNEVPVKLEGQLGGGGGIIPYGKTKPVQIVALRMAPNLGDSGSKDIEVFTSKELDRLSDGQMLVNVHELFHCFQGQQTEWQFGNLSFNPDANYALYSEVEGLALERAYLEQDAAKAKAHLLDFLAARRLKRTSMEPEERNQESEEEMMEGTATYAEARLLEELAKGYTPKLTPKDDPWYGGFKKSEAFLATKLGQLRKDQGLSLQARSKSYSYGCFQALLLSRHYPEWRADFFASRKMMDRILEEKLKPTPEFLDTRAKTFQERFPLEALQKKHAEQIRRRDEAYRLITERKGRSYVVNFKPTGEYLRPKAREPRFEIGITHLFPKGIESLQIQEVTFTGKETPTQQDQLYYLKWVDTAPQPKPHTVEGREVSPGIYTDATFTCEGFSLRAPKLKVQEDAGRVKVTVLEKVRPR